MDGPEISVVIPAWGDYVGKALDEALASVREQDAPKRIIVVDNASEPPIELGGPGGVVRTPSRLTVGGARNHALAEVTTPYVVFWDADDLMLPGTLGFLLDEITADPGLSAVAAGILEESGDPHRWPPAWSARLARHPRAFALAHSLWSLFPSTGATIMRTQQVRDCGGYDASELALGGEDWVLGVSLAQRGQIGLRKRPGRIYRRLGQSDWEAHRSPALRLRQARAVRNRLRSDPAIPRLARHSAIPLALLHPFVLLIAAPLARSIRALAPGRK